MENKDYLLKISDYKHGTIKLLEDLHKLKDELVHGALESVKREAKLQTMEKDLSVTTGVVFFPNTSDVQIRKEYKHSHN